jgi:hypothetical protein
LLKVGGVLFLLIFISPFCFGFNECVLELLLSLFNLVPRAFCFRGWMVSEKGPGIGWSVFQPDWSMILNIIIQYTGEIIIILAKREWSDKLMFSS